MRQLLTAILFLLIATPAAAQDSYSSLYGLNGNLPTMDSTGAMLTPSHIVIGSCVLTAGVCTVTLTGAAVFSSVSSYKCGSSDQTLAATLSSISITNGSTFVIYGLLTHTINYSCIGW